MFQRHSTAVGQIGGLMPRRDAGLLGFVARILLFVIFLQLVSPMTIQLTFGVAEAYGDQVVCGVDQNNDGYLGDSGDTQNCIIASGSCSTTGTCYSSEVTTTQYECPTTLQMYNDANSCNNACGQNANCINPGTQTGTCSSSTISTTQYQCPSNMALYSDAATCDSNCEMVQNCVGSQVQTPGTCSSSAVAAGYTCPTNQKTYSTASTCDAACEQVANCTTSSTSWACSVYGSYPSLSCGASPGGSCTIPSWDVVVSFDSSCNINDLNGVDGSGFWLPVGLNMPWGAEDSELTIYNTSSSYSSFSCPFAGGSACSGNPPQCSVGQACVSAGSTTDYVCSLNSQSYTTQGACTTACVSSTTAYTCPITGGSTCSSGSTPTCYIGESCVTNSNNSSSYLCSLNNQLYSTQGSCTTACVSNASLPYCPLAGGSACTGTPPSCTSGSACVSNSKTTPLYTCSLDNTQYSTQNECGSACVHTLTNCDTAGQLCPIGLQDCTPSTQLTGTPSCFSGTLNTGTGQCDAAVTSESCPAGYSYVSANSDCEEVVNCSSGGILSDSENMCSVQLMTANCPPGFTWSYAVQGCEQAVSCPSGTFNTPRGRCETAVTDICGAVGYTWDSSLGICDVAPTCTSGTYNPTTKQCETPAGTVSCPSGYIWNATYSLCTASPSCPSGGSWNGTQCTATPGSPQPFSGSATFTAGQSSNWTVPLGVSSVTVTMWGAGGWGGDSNANGQDWCTGGGGGGGLIYNYNLSVTQNTAISYSVLQSIDGGTGSTTFGTLSAGSGRVGYNWTLNPGENGGNGGSASDGNNTASGGVGGVNAWYGAPQGGTGGTTISTHGGFLVGGGGGGSGSEQEGGGDGGTAGNPVQSGVCSVVPSGSFGTGGRGCPGAGGGGGSYGNGGTGTNDGGGGYGGGGGGVCAVNAHLPGGNGQINLSWTGVIPTCPANYTWDGTACSAGSSTCPSGGTYNSGIALCQAAAIATCPSGMTMSGSVCAASPTCPAGGSFDSTTGMCKTTLTQACPTNYSYDSTNNICYEVPSCTTGTFNPSLGECVVPASSLCPANYTYSSANGDCEEPPSCTNGTYSTTDQQCAAAATYNCPSGFTYSTSTHQCESNPCSSGAYDTSTNTCIGCPAGSSYDATNSVCWEAAGSGNSCTSPFAYNGSRSRCESATPVSFTCPVGPQFPCIMNGTTAQCSPNPCVNLTKNPPIIVDPASQQMTNDGGTDANGNCLGQVYIFPGANSQCQHVGANDGFHNCCNSNKPLLGDSTGSVGLPALTGGIKVISGLFQAVGAASDANTAYNAISQANAAVAASNGQLYVGTMANFDGTYAVGTMNSAGQMVNVTGASVTANGLNAAAPSVLEGSGMEVGGQVADLAPDATTSAVTGITNLIDPYQLAGALASAVIPGPAGTLSSVTIECMGGPAACGLAVAMAIVNEIMSLLTATCTPQDIMTAQLNKSSMCYDIGSLCSDKWPLIGCVQKSEAYCCFNSLLATLIQIQGRPQLSSFVNDPTGLWGSAQSPNCRGFTPAEFQSLDFSKIDLTTPVTAGADNHTYPAYLGVIEQNITANLQNGQSTMQNSITNSINNFYKNTTR